MATLNVLCTLYTVHSLYMNNEIYSDHGFFLVFASFDTLGEAKMRQFSNEIHALGVFSTPVY